MSKKNVPKCTKTNQTLIKAKQIFLKNIELEKKIQKIFIIKQFMFVLPVVTS